MRLAVCAARGWGARRVRFGPGPVVPFRRVGCGRCGRPCPRAVSIRAARAGCPRRALHHRSRRLNRPTAVNNPASHRSATRVHRTWPNSQPRTPSLSTPSPRAGPALPGRVSPTSEPVGPADEFCLRHKGFSVRPAGPALPVPGARSAPRTPYRLCAAAGVLAGGFAARSDARCFRCRSFGRKFAWNSLWAAGGARAGFYLSRAYLRNRRSLRDPSHRLLQGKLGYATWVSQTWVSSWRRTPRRRCRCAD